MIRKLTSSDFNSILAVINDAAQAYKGVIPDDLWKEPYMPAEELKRRLKLVSNSGWVEDEVVVGVMGIQPAKDAAKLMF